MVSTASSSPRRGILSLSLGSKASLYSSYMPFIKNGGIFVPTKAEYKMGEEVFLLLSLLETKEKVPISGKVVWVTPSSKFEGKRPAGIGIQFAPLDKGATREKIERLLAGALVSDRPTHTI